MNKGNFIIMRQKASLLRRFFVVCCIGAAAFVVTKHMTRPVHTPRPYVTFDYDAMTVNGRGAVTNYVCVDTKSPSTELCDNECHDVYVCDEAQDFSYERAANPACVGIYDSEHRLSLNSIMFRQLHHFR